MTRTLYRKVLDQRLTEIERQLDKLGRKHRAASGMDCMRCLEAIIALEQERADVVARLRQLDDRAGIERRRDAIRFEFERLGDDAIHSLSRWIGRLDAHFVAG